MANREESIESWIQGEKDRAKRRERIIPSSAARISHEPVGNSLEAMERVAYYLGEHPEVPEMTGAGINSGVLRLTFDGLPDLPAPFIYQAGDGDHSVWALPVADAVQLPAEGTPGRQIQPVTAIGNDTEGGKMFINTRELAMGVRGREEFVRGVMTGQVMEQATEPWSRHNHIWLVGFQELAPMLIGYLSQFNPNFHDVETLDQIAPEDLKGAPAMLFVLGSDSTTLDQFVALNADNAGLLMDGEVGPGAPFMTEEPSALNNDTGATGAVLYNCGPEGMVFFPHVVQHGDRYYEGMVQHQAVMEEQASAAAESLTVDDFLTPTPPHSPEEDTEPDQQPLTPTPAEADAGSPQTEDEQPDDTPAMEGLRITDEELEAFLAEHSQDSERVRDTTPADAPVTTDPSRAPQEQVSPELRPADPEDEATNESEEKQESENQFSDVINLPVVEKTAGSVRLLGKPELTLGSSRITGNSAELCAFLILHGGAASQTEITAALWPGEELSENSARLKLSRLVKKINNVNNDVVTTGEQWTISGVTTDLQEVREVLKTESSEEGLVTQTCDRIAPPLEGCHSWAADYRENISAELQQLVGAAVRDRGQDSPAVNRAGTEAMSRVQQRNTDETA